MPISADASKASEEERESNWMQCVRVVREEREMMKKKKSGQL